MHFLFVFKLLFAKKGGGIFWRPQFALWQPKIYTCLPVGAHTKKLILDPGGPVLPIPVILLPLCPGSLMLKNPQRHKIIHEMHPLGHKEQFLGRIYPVRVISVTVV